MFKPSDPNGTRYEPIAQIGRGGMAEVLLALAQGGGGIQRLAVLKRAWPELSSDPDFVAMFLDEARLALRLNHANVVQTYEILASDDELAIAMEYLDGQPLTRVLNRLLRGRNDLPLPLRLRVLTSVLAGLEYAHALCDLDGTPFGVVHRDISPANVFITYDGQVKLVDFGVAKTLAASHQTRPGTLKGKIAYMAPEQLQRESIDHRADLFSVGVMMWEMLAARRLWQGMTEVEIVSHLASGRALPPLPGDIPGLPPGLDAICARALDPDPDRRYQTAAELEMDLQGVLSGSADSHTRNLGKLVTQAFAAEHAERQAIIERCVRRSGAMPTELPTIAARETPDPFEVASAEPERAPVPAQEATAAPEPTPTPTPLARFCWLRQAATFSGLIAAVALLLAAAGWRRPLSSARGAQPAVEQSPPPPSAAARAHAAAPAAPPAAATVRMRPQPRHTIVANGTQSETSSYDPPRARPHHHAVHEDEDGTLPPSIDLDP